MARTRSTLHACVRVEQVFDFMSDLRHAPLWDPQASSVEKLTPGPVGLGTRFLMVGSFMGRELHMPYEIVGYERPGHLVIEGATRLLRYRDEISFVDEGTGTRVLYDAAMELRAAPPLVDRALQLVWNRVASVATRGMARAIEVHFSGALALIHPAARD